MKTCKRIGLIATAFTLKSEKIATTSSMLLLHDLLTIASRARGNITLSLVCRTKTRSQYMHLNLAIANDL